MAFLLLPNPFWICDSITVTFDGGVQGLQTYKVLPRAIHSYRIVAVITDLLLFFFSEMYIILVSDSSKSENNISQDPSMLHSVKRKLMHF